MRGLSPSRLLGGEQEPTYLEAAAHAGTRGWEPEDRRTEITARMALGMHRGDTPAWHSQHLPRLPRAKPTSPFPFSAWDQVDLLTRRWQVVLSNRVLGFVGTVTFRACKQ